MEKEKENKKEFDNIVPKIKNACHFACSNMTWTNVVIVIIIIIMVYHFFIKNYLDKLGKN